MDNKKKTNLSDIVCGFNKDWELKNWEESGFKKVTYDSRSEKKWDLGGIPQEVKTVIEGEGEEKQLQSKIKSIFIYRIKH